MNFNSRVRVDRERERERERELVSEVFNNVAVAAGP